MGRKQKVTAKGRLDKFYHLAKDQGYRARSAFKLVQLNRKYQFLNNARVCIDLCAAPGGWLQVAAKNMPVSSLIIGVDLVPIRPIPHVVTFADDITSQSCRQKLKSTMGEYQADCVLHDGAPNVGQNWVKDAYTQAELTLHAAKLACEFLRPGGVFVTKVFRSKEYHAVLWVLQQLFKKVEATKPTASRNVSAEIFVVATGYLAPKKLDMAFFDPKHVFDLPDQPQSSESKLFSQKERHRSGYDESNPTLFKEVPIADFIHAADPIALLAESNRLVWDENSVRWYGTHALTTPDIKEMVYDLKLLGKGDFRKLLKWRLKMREVDAYRKRKAQEAARQRGDGNAVDDDDDVAAAAGLPSESESEVSEEEEMVKTMTAYERKQKKEKKKARKRKAKQRQRIALKMNTEADIAQESEGRGLFSLDSIKESSSSRVPTMSDSEESDQATDAEEEDADAENDDDDDDSDEDDYNRRLDQEMDALYNDFLERKELGRQRKVIQRKKKERLEDQEELEEEEQQDLDGAAADELEMETDVNVNSNELLQSDRQQASDRVSSRAAQWFSKDLFQGVEDDEDDEDLIQSMADQGRKARKSKKQAAESTSMDGIQATGAADHDQEDEDEDGTAFTEVKAARTSTSATANGTGMHRPVLRSAQEQDWIQYGDSKHRSKRKRRGSAGSEDEEGEEELESGSSSDDSEAEEEEIVPTDAVEHARALALGTMMLRKKFREEMMDDQFNRYTFNDRHLAPDWFADDERKHFSKRIPIPHALEEKYMAKFEDVDARPIKKVAEAKMRKKKRLLRKLERAKSQANSLAGSSDLSENAKSRAIEKLYAKAQGRAHPGKVNVVARSFKAGGKVVSGAKFKTVDRRMKKDTKAAKRVAKPNHKAKKHKSKHQKRH